MRLHLLLVFLTSLSNFSLMDLAFFHKIKFFKLFPFCVSYYSQLNNVKASHNVKDVYNLTYSNRESSFR